MTAKKYDAEGRPLRVLVLTVWYPTEDKPVPGIFIREFAVQLAVHHEVMVVAYSVDPTLSGHKVEREVFAGLPTVRLTTGKGLIPKVRYLSRLWHQIRVTKQIFDEFKPDVIQANNYETTIPALLLGRKRRVPIIVFEQYSGFYTGIVKGIELWKAKWGFRRVDLVMPVSQWLKELIEGLGIRANYDPMPIGVDTKFFRPADGHPPQNNPTEGLMVASLQPIKGHIYMVEALGLLKQRGVKVLLHLAGDGPERVGLEQRVRELGVEDYIRFHGVLRKHEVADLMHRCDFAFTSSLGETFGAGLAEGFATGLPTLGTDIRAIPEMISEERGMLVKPANAEAFADGMEAFLQKLPFYDREAIAAWAQDRFDFQSVVMRFEKVCRKLLAERAERSGIG